MSKVVIPLIPKGKNRPSIPVSIACLSVLLLSTVGCQQPTHPNQINAFDGDSYDVLNEAHAALGALRGQAASAGDTYKTAFNHSAEAYSSAYDAYRAYRAAPFDGESPVLKALSVLSISVQTLDEAMQQSLPVAPATQNSIRQKWFTRRERFAGRSPSAFNLVDIMTILEVGAEVASKVPGMSNYAGIAQAVIEAARAATDVLASRAGAPIDLATIAPIPPLP